jgi:hypothetical protein
VGGPTERGRPQGGSVAEDRLERHRERVIEVHVGDKRSIQRVVGTLSFVMMSVSR